MMSLAPSAAVAMSFVERSFRSSGVGDPLMPAAGIGPAIPHRAANLSGPTTELDGSQDFAVLTVVVLVIAVLSR
jgi:hypothetical protein